MKSLNKIFFHSKKGQATVEYLLLAVVIIVIGKVVVSPMGKTLQAWATKMLGPKGYYACLMEYGQIPGKKGKKLESLGIECGAHKVAALGDLKSLEGGSGLTTGGGSSSGSSGGGSSSGGGDSSEEGGSGEESSDSKDKRDRKKRKPSSSNSGDGSGDSFTEGSGTDPAHSNRFPALKSGNKSTNSGKQARRKRRKKRPKRSGPKDVTLKADTNSSDDGGSWETGEGYLGRISIEFEDEEGDKPPPVFEAQGSASQAGTETPAAQKKKNRVQTNRLGDGRGGNITDMKPLSLGGYMKWLFIAVLLIAVVLVIGSQILEFQNADT